MTKITVNGNTYAIGKLNALTQFHISRRLAPLLAQMGISLHTLRSGMAADLTDFLPALGPVTEMIAKMPDEDANYVIFTCLAVVTRQSGEKFSAITTGSNLLYEDIDMTTMLRLVVETVKENMGSFFLGLTEEKSS